MDERIPAMDGVTVERTNYKVPRHASCKRIRRGDRIKNDQRNILVWRRTINVGHALERHEQDN